MSTAVEGDDKRDALANSRHHSKRSDQGVIALNVDDVPIGFDTPDVDTGGKIQVGSRGPRFDADDAHSAHVLLGLTLSCWIRRQHGDSVSQVDKPGSHLVNMRFYAAHERKVASGNHENTHWCAPVRVQSFPTDEGPASKGAHGCHGKP